MSPLSLTLHILFALSFLTLHISAHHSSSSLTPRDFDSAQVITKCKTKGTFALTFDDGPFTFHNKISDYLFKQGINATFFVNGDNYECIYSEENVARLKRSFAQGHAIGHHTWSHPHIPEISEQQLIEEMRKLEVAFRKILGIKTHLFRPPYGELTDKAIGIIKSRGYKIITWSVDTKDADGATAQQSISTYKQVAKKFPAPQIALNHETEESTFKQVVPEAVKTLKKAGYQLVSVPECLGLDPYYERVGKPQARDDSWKCT